MRLSEARLKRLQLDWIELQVQLGSQIQAMDDLRFRLNFDLSKKNEIYHHS